MKITDTLILFLIALMCACSSSSDEPTIPAATLPTAAPTMSLEIADNSLNLGQSTTISWTSTNDASCVASDGWGGPLDATGSRSITPANPGDSIYTITCTNSLGSASQSVSLKTQTVLSQRLTSVSAVDETDYPYAGEIRAGALLADGTGPVLIVMSSVNTAKGGGTLLSVQSSRPLTGLLLGAQNIAGAESYYEIDLTKKAATESKVNAEGIVSYTLEKSRVSVSASPGRTTALQAQKKAYQASTQANTQVYLYDLQIGFSSEVPENVIGLSIVGVYSTTATATALSARQGTAVPKAATSADRSPPASTTVNLSAAAATSQYLAFTLSWTQPVDLDLHVNTPSGGHIYWANKTADGGALDLDAWPACGQPHGNAEHITWASSRPPPRVYTVSAVYYDMCNVSTPVQYLLTINNSGQQQFYRETSTKPFYTGVLNASDTNDGLISLMLINETIAPGNAGFDSGEALIAMQALRAIVENRKADPSKFSSQSSSTRDIIITPARKCQFEKFCGSISSAATQHAKEVLVPLYKDKMDIYKKYYDNVFDIAEAVSVTDPYKGTTTIGDVAVENGTYGVYRHGGSPGDTFVLLPNGSNISGQDFFALKKGIITR